MVWTIIVTLVAGTIVGLLGKAIAPGDRESFPLWLTVICGIGGCLIGSFLYYEIFGVADNVAGNSHYGANNTTKGIDWMRHVWQVGTAAVLVVLAARLYGKKKA